MKSYEKLKKRSLLEFHKDCLAAARGCPQYRQDPFEAEDILLGEVSKSEVVGYWSAATVLWNAGYSVDLSVESRLIIKEYRLDAAMKSLEEMLEEE